jgi:hypothetical protein
MDWTFVNGSLAVMPAEMLRADDKLCAGDGGRWGSVHSTSPNRTSEREGIDLKLLGKLCADTGRSLWFCTPMGIGFASVETELYVTQNNNASRDAMELAIAPNLATIKAALYTEHKTRAEYCLNDLIAGGYPADRRLYIELSNEIWNSNFPRAYNLAVGLGRNLSGTGTVSGVGAGYAFAAFCRAWKDAIDAIRPTQAYQFVIGAQTVNTGFSAGLVQGWGKYVTDNPITALPISYMGTATTGYMDGAFKWTTGQSEGTGNPFGSTSEGAFNSAFAAAADVSADNLFSIIEAWHFNPANTANSPVYGVMQDTAAHVSHAAANGYSWIGQYEGSFHENVLTSAGKLGAVYPAAKTLVISWLFSANAYRVQKLLIDELKAAYPSAIINNYFEVLGDASFDYKSPWAERRPNKINVAQPDTAAAAWDDIKVA